MHSDVEHVEMMLGTSEVGLKVVSQENAASTKVRRRAP